MPNFDMNTVPESPRELQLAIRLKHATAAYIASFLGFLPSKYIDVHTLHMDTDKRQLILDYDVVDVFPGPREDDDDTR